MKILPAALTTAAVAALLLIGATPAHAEGESIAPGDSLYAINCDDLYNDWQLLSVDPPTALSTKIGNGTGSVGEDDACAGQAAYNPVTGVSYYIQWTRPEGVVYHLATIDRATGVSTTIAEFFTDDGDIWYPDVTAIAIDNSGDAYAFDEDYTLWSLDLATAELTPIQTNVLCCIYAMAVDPTTDDLYAIDYGNGIYRVDKADGDTTYVGTIGYDAGSFSTYSLQVDSAGRFWVEVDLNVDGPTLATLWSFTLDNLVATYSGDFEDDPYYTESLLIAPTLPAPPVLPATGPGTGVAPLFGGGLLVLGVAAVGATVLIRRRAAA